MEEAEENHPEHNLGGLKKSTQNTEWGGLKKTTQNTEWRPEENHSEHRKSTGAKGNYPSPPVSKEALATWL